MSHLSHEDKMLYSDFFLKVDREFGNGDGALSLSEFEKLMNICGHTMTRHELAQSFVAIDKDGNWKITLDEFLAILPSAVPPNSRNFLAAKIRRIFDAYDLNKDGYVTKEEMEKVLSEAAVGLGEETLEELIKECDTDGDGRLNFEEFLTIYTRDDDDDKDKGTKDNDPKDNCSKDNAESSTS